MLRLKGISAGVAQSAILHEMPMDRSRLAMLASIATLLLAVSAVAATPGTRQQGVAIVRLGQHGDFTRIVIETSRRFELVPALSPDGKLVAVAFPPSLGLVLPHRLEAPISRLSEMHRRNGRPPRLLIWFDRPVTLRSNFILPIVSRPGFRLVLDFEAVGETIEQPPAPEPDAILKEAGFVAARFGLDDHALLAQLADQPDGEPAAVRMTIDVGTTAARRLIRIARQSAQFGRFQTLYELTSTDHRLAGIVAEWGKDPQKPLDEEAAEDLLINLSVALTADGFSPTSAELGKPLADAGRIGFSGIDPAGRLATLSVHALPSGTAEPAGLFLRLSMVDPAVAE